MNVTATWSGNAAHRGGKRKKNVGACVSWSGERARWTHTLAPPRCIDVHIYLTNNKWRCSARGSTTCRVYKDNTSLFYSPGIMDSGLYVYVHRGNNIIVIPWESALYKERFCENGLLTRDNMRKSHYPRPRGRNHRHQTRTHTIRSTLAKGRLGPTLDMLMAFFLQLLSVFIEFVY